MDDLANLIDELVPDPPPAADDLWIEGLSLDLPLELYVRPSAQGERIEVSMPSQTFMTSILPVFHRMRLRIVASEDENQE